ncbi:MAG: cysteine--tRNA ligase, partial [Desulfobulbaceae bacterium]|nr:cysteine--tRNA ligase [Desulfobulbaceae bacterium]
WQAHYKNTGPEIWRQTEGKVTDVISTLGTSGTAMGLSKYFREHHPHVRVIAMEPFYGHKIQGLKNMKESYKPGIFDKKLPHKIVNVHDKDAFDTSRLLAEKEGILVGMSSGAAMFAALERAKEIGTGYIVVILPDGGERYLSTTLFKGPAKKESKEKPLRFYNTLSRKKQNFKPINKERVTLYACGPTAYKPPTLAHCRRFIVADLIRRHLESKQMTVDLYMNFTDIDDNTIEESEKAGMSLGDFTEKHIKQFKHAFKILDIKEAKGYPKASEHVSDMIDISHELIHKGYAYEKHGSIYFNISKFPAYGKLSGIDLSKIQIGKTVDLDNYDKDNPRDFTLLKRSTLNELKKGIFFETDWGNVRPGWHIECSAMSTRYLGETIDIHTASQDLMFPHHENEIAIAEALTGKPLAKYWLHSGLLLNNGKKMSEDAGNVVTLDELLEQGFTGRELRLMLLWVHYRKPLNYSQKRLLSVRTALKRIDEFTRKVLCWPTGLPHPEIATYCTTLEKDFFNAMDDDLNISKAMGTLFNFIKKTNPILQHGGLDKEQQQSIMEILNKINCVFGIMNLKKCSLDPKLGCLIRQREKARECKNWQEADQVREELAHKGITVKDSACCTVWDHTEIQNQRK